MAESTNALDWQVDPRAKWLHDLRNAVNMAGVTVSMGQGFLAKGDRLGASEMFVEAADAVGRCRALLAEAGAVLGIGADAHAFRPASTGGTTHSASSPDR